jgi:hypothetical protein
MGTSSILYQTHIKSRSLLSSFSSIQIISKEKIQPTLIIQELQTIKCNKATQHHLQSSLSLLSYYVMTTTNKRYSYPRVAAIQIDVHLTGENSINTPDAFHVRFIYDPRPYISRGPRRQPFASSHKDETEPYT